MACSPESTRSYSAPQYRRAVAGDHALANRAAPTTSSRPSAPPVDPKCIALQHRIWSAVGHRRGSGTPQFLFNIELTCKVGVRSWDGSSLHHRPVGQCRRRPHLDRAILRAGGPRQTVEPERLRHVERVLRSALDACRKTEEPGHCELIDRLSHASSPSPELFPPKNPKRRP
jgi:hypothetical protein